MSFIRKKNSKLLYILIFLLIGICLWFILTYKISSVDCYSQFGPCPEKVLLSLDKLKGQKITKYLNSDNVKKILPLSETIKKNDVYYRFPSKLVVNITLRQPVIRVSSGLDGTYALVDNEGYVTGLTTSAVLPLLKTETSYSPGQKLDPSALLAESIMVKISESQKLILEGNLKASILKVGLKDLHVILDVNYLSSDWFKSLQMVLARSKIENSVPKIIDLRYTEPVLTY